MVDLANEYREKLLDAVSMFDDEIMELYLEGKEIPTAKIRAAIRQRSRSQRSQHRAYHQQRGDPFPNPFHIVTPLSAAECRSVCFLLPVYRIFSELQHFCK